MKDLLRQHGMAAAVFLCLAGLSVNAVLIQTIMTDDVVLKNGVRGAVLVVAAIVLVIAKPRVPVAMYLMVLASGVLLVVRQNSDQLSFIFVLLLVTALLQVEERKLDRVVLVCSFVSLTLVFVLLALGITENSVIEFRSRMTFGTDGVPFFYNLVYGSFVIGVLYVFKYKAPHRGLVLVLSLAATTMFFLFTDARGGFLSFLAFLVLLFLVPKLSRFSIFRLIIGILPLLFLILAFGIAALGENKTANDLLSIRPTLFQQFFAQVNVVDALLSTSVKQFPLAVDNSYIHLLFGGGVFLFCAFVILFARAVRRLFEQGRYPELAFLIATSIYFNSEGLLPRIENVFVVYFWYLVLRESLSWARSGMSGAEPSGLPNRTRPRWARRSAPSVSSALEPGAALREI